MGEQETSIDILIPTLDKSGIDRTTAAISKCLPVNRILLSYATPLGRARQELIEASETEISMFLDSDVVMEKGEWCDVALRLLESGAGCVVLQPPLAVGPLQNYVSFYFPLRTAIRGSFFGTMATLFRTDLLKGIQIPESLDSCEDLFILFYLQSKKARIETIKVPGMHYHSPDPVVKGRWIGVGLARLQKAVGFRKVLPYVLRNVIFYIPATAIVSIIKGRKDVMGYSLALWREYLRGYFSE